MFSGSIADNYSLTKKAYPPNPKFIQRQPTPTSPIQLNRIILIDFKAAYSTPNKSPKPPLSKLNNFRFATNPPA